MGVCDIARKLKLTHEMVSYHIRRYVKNKGRFAYFVNYYISEISKNFRNNFRFLDGESSSHASQEEQGENDCGDFGLCD